MWPEFSSVKPKNVVTMYVTIAEIMHFPERLFWRTLYMSSV